MACLTPVSATPPVAFRPERRLPLAPPPRRESDPESDPDPAAEAMLPTKLVATSCNTPPEASPEALLLVPVKLPAEAVSEAP